MALFCATYEYTDDVERRMEVRPAHRDWLSAQPQLMASGPTDANGAVLIFEGDSAEQIDKILEGDPLHAENLIVSRRVVGWQIVRGKWLDQVTS